METMGFTVLIMAGILTLFVGIVLGIGAWILLKVVSAIEPVRDMLEKNTLLIDKLVTVVIAKGPMEYSAIRAADSLVSYDGDSSTTTEQEPYDGEETGEYLGAPGNDFGDDFINGTFK